MGTKFTSKTGSAVLALSLLSGNAWGSGSCAQPQDLTVLQTAALQQQLMVAAFSCRDIAAYNNFVISYQGALQESDRALLKFFLQRNARTGDDDYNAFKTLLANDSSLRSLNDPEFCSDADLSFAVVRQHRDSLAELVAERPSPIQTGYMSCLPGAREPTLVADATPTRPTPHQALRDVPPVAGPASNLAAAGNASQSDAGVPAPHAYTASDERYGDNSRSGDSYGADTTPAADSRDVSFGDEPPAPPHMVRGSDGHWYLMVR